MTKRMDSPSAAVRIRVMKRDRFTCQYCGVSGTDAELEIDHIIPVSKGGSHHISNLTTACRSCNQEKGNRPQEPLANLQKRLVSKSKVDVHPLVGMFFHTYNDKKRIEYQAQVVGVDGNVVLAQMFSFLWGEPTSVRVFSKEFVYSDKCKLYATHEAWIDACDRHNEQHRAEDEQEREQ